MKSLAEILTNSDRKKLAQVFDRTEEARDFAPLPPGTYQAHVHSVGLFSAKTGTPGFKIQFRVAEGDFEGRMLFYDLWLTQAAMPHTKRDCQKIGIKTFDEMESVDITPGKIRCRVKLALRRTDDGEESNHVKKFDVVGMDEPKAEPFAPGDLSDPEHGDASFDPARLNEGDES